jgi:hypothetical protein
LTYWAWPRASRRVFADFRSAAFTHAAMILNSAVPTRRHGEHREKPKDWIKPGAHPSGVDSRISSYRKTP